MNTIHSVSNTSRMRSSEAVAVRNSFSFRTFMMRVMLVVGMMICCGNLVWGETDILNRTLTGVSGTSYTDWSGKTSNSDAVFAGNSAGGNDAIQLRTTNSNSGIITTASGGSRVAKIKIIWNSNTASGRTLDIYGKNSAYSLAADLYNSSTRGTKIGSIVCGTSTELTITTGDYAYIGLRSNNNALYIDEIRITWEICGSITFSALYTSNTVLTNTSVSVNSDISVTFYKNNGTAPQYYTTGTAVRAYAKNTFTVTATSGSDPITSIFITFGSSDGSNVISTDVGTYSNGSWTGSERSVTFTIGGNSGNRRIAGIEVCTTTTYTVICTDSDNGTIRATPDTDLLVGETITVTATPNDGYVLSSITATDESSNSLTLSGSGNTRTFTMPASNVTVSATFTPIASYTITWSVNGTTSSGVYNSGHTLNGGEIPSPSKSDCDAIKVFVGWTTSPISDETDETPSPLYSNSTLPTVTAAATYYAVFAKMSNCSLYSGSLTEGDYVIYYSGKAMDTVVSSNRLGYVEVTPVNNIISNPDVSMIWHIAPSGDYWTIYNAEEGKYAAATGTKNQAKMIVDGMDDKSLWTASGSSTYEFVNKNNAAHSVNANLRNNDIYGFACYGTGTGGALSLYKVSYLAYSTTCGVSVIYDANGATSGSAPIDENSPYTLVNGEASVTVLGNTGNLIKTGHTFAGWNTAVDGSGTSYLPNREFTITENITLYAQWTPNQYIVAWYANGSLIESIPIDYGKSFLDDGYEIDGLEYLDGDAEGNACDEMHFVGWSEERFDAYEGAPTLLQYYDIVGIEVTDNKNYHAVFAKVTPGTSVTWNLVENVSELNVNDSIIIVSGDYALGTTQNTNNRDAVGITNNGDDVEFDEQTGVQGLKLVAGTVNNTFGLYTGSGYLYAASSSNNYLRTKNELDDNGSWLINIVNGETTVEAQGTNTRNKLRKNSSSALFACYSSDQDAVSIYKKYGEGDTYSNYTTFCPCNYGTITGIANGDMVWAGKNVGAEWNDKDNWVVYNSSEPKYHLASEAPSTENNVFVVQKGECGITVSPNISENITCGNLTMFNGLSLAIAENKNLTINGKATFTNGIINGNVTFGSNATISGVSRSSHVDGIVTKSGAANSTGFYFPTGSNGNLGKVVVTDGPATNVSVQYFCNPDGFGTNDLPRWWNAADMSGENPFNHVSNVEYWRISSNEAITANFVAVASAGMQHFNSETAEEDKIPTNIQMAFYDNKRWTNVGGSAFINDSTLTITGAEIPASATRDISGNYTTFGSKSKSTVLPIELVSFTANCNGRSSIIEWTTATEKNNDFFVLERSNDAINFKEIARIAGAGNSIEPLNYVYTDYGIRSGDNYYRLVQVDYDGTSTASEIIVANCPAETLGEPDVLAFPNPFDDNLTLHFENFGNVQATVEVYDMLGRMVQTQKVNCSQNDYEVVLRLAGLSDGTYNVRISTAEFVVTRMVVKE